MENRPTFLGIYREKQQNTRKKSKQSIPIDPQSIQPDFGPNLPDPPAPT